MATTTKGLIAKEDIKHWDGSNSTFNRIDSTGGTQSLTPVGREVDCLSVYGSSESEKNASTISSAIAGIGGNEVTLVFAPGIWTIGQSITIPSNITVKMPRGATFSISNGVTFTISGSLEAGLYQIFSGSGVVSGFNADKIYPVWWGAVGDGVTDDTAAIQAAIDYAIGSGQGTVNLPIGSYAVTSINIYPNSLKSLVLIGDGPFNSKFVKFGAGTDPLINISGTAGGGGGNGVVSKCQFKNFMIQGTSKLFVGIYADTLAHFSMEGVQIATCSIGLHSLGSLIFVCRSCFINSNAIGFQADQSPVNGGYSNLIKFDDCVFQSNTTNDARLNRGQQIVFQNCDIESSTATECFYVASTYEDETLYSSLTFNNCWWEGNTGKPLVHDASTTWLSMSDCTLLGPAATIEINGADNRVSLKSCYGTELLDVTDTTGTAYLESCLFPTYTLAGSNNTIINTSNSSGIIAAQFNKINSSSGTVNATSGVPVTIGTTATGRTFIVSAYISGTSVNETATGVVIEGVISNQSFGSNVALSISGTDIQVTQSTGTGYNVNYSILRIG